MQVAHMLQSQQQTKEQVRNFFEVNIWICAIIVHYIIHTYTIKHFAGTIETKKKPEREQATSSSGKSNVHIFSYKNWIMHPNNCKKKGSSIKGWPNKQCFICGKKQTCQDKANTTNKKTKRVMKMNGKKHQHEKEKTDVLHSPCTKMIVRNYILLVHKPGRKMFSHLLVLCILYCYLLTMNCSTFSTLKDLSHFITWKSYGQEQHKRNFSKLSHLKVAWREQGNLTYRNRI